MELTDAELAEGRRLLKIAQTITRSEIAETYRPFDDWLREHAPALLARREEIAREAVREFAEAVIVDFTEERDAATRRAECHAMTEGRIDAEARAEEWNEAIIKVTQLTAARGVTLNEKP